MLPSNLFFFDTETQIDKKLSDTKNEYNKLLFGWIIAGRYEEGKVSRRKEIYFETIEQFWKALESRLLKGKTLYVFAHNLGFDLTIVDFWRISETKGFDINFFVTEDPPTIFGFKWKDCDVIMLDTLNFFRQSLATLGESVGIKKGKMPKTRTKTKAFINYGLTDVKILEHTISNLLDFIREEDLGGLGFSGPSIAMSAYKRRFMTHKIHLHDRKNVCQLERDSYYGGLVHNYFIGRVREPLLYCVDINSLYPSMMLKEFPTKLVGHQTTLSNSLLKEISKRYAVVARVELNNNKYPLPIRLDKKLCLALGRYETTLAGPELKRAIELNLITKVKEVAWYEKAPIFVDFVNYFWNKRKQFKQEGNEVYQTFTKLILNSLYGKFGQRGYQFEKLNNNTLRMIYELKGKELPKEYQDRETAEIFGFGSEKRILIGLEEQLTIRRIGNEVQIEIPIAEHFESFPLIASYVTSYGRERLRNLVAIAGNKQCYYVDTDSLFVTTLGLDRLKKAGEVDNKQLGKLKIESVESNCHFYCPKDYIFGSKVVMKGIRKDAIKIAEGEYEQLRFEGIKSVLKREPLPYILISKIKKKNYRRFSKGKTTKSGWTQYFNLPEDLNQAKEFDGLAYLFQ